MLSVVIATRDAGRDIGPCLAALERQVGADAEIVVADGSGDGTAELVEREFPWARLVRGEAGRGLAELRAAGLTRARGEIVALTDVGCRVGPDWVSRLARQPWHAYAAVGGAVISEGRTGLADWTAFLAEYGPYLPPLAAGPVTHLPGNNVAFRRDALERAGLIGAREFWKVFALWRLATLGERFWTDPELVVYHGRSAPPREFARQRYLHGRCFGARRLDRAGWAVGGGRCPPPARLARVAAAPLVPLLLTARLARAVHGKRPYRRMFWRGLPLIFLFHLAWGWGELHGYLRGSGGACARLT
jgi:glycosyltransferase involved in cell wall biosynthesis